MDRSTPGLPVHHQLLELAQTDIHRVGDAMQASKERIKSLLPGTAHQTMRPRILELSEPVDDLERSAPSAFFSPVSWTSARRSVKLSVETSSCSPETGVIIVPSGNAWRTRPLGCQAPSGPRSARAVRRGDSLQPGRDAPFCLWSLVVSERQAQQGVMHGHAKNRTCVRESARMETGGALGFSQSCGRGGGRRGRDELRRSDELREWP